MLVDSEKKYRSKLICLVLAAIPVVLFSFFATPVYSVPDDFIQLLFANGRFLAGAPGYLMPYTLFPVSAPLAALYGVLPQVPWYFLLLQVLTVVSFACGFDLVARMRVSPTSRAVALVAALALEIACELYFTYTIVAFLAVAAGIMLLLDRAAFARDPRPHLSDLAALLLIAVGFSLRPESGMATFAVFCPFAVFVLVKNHNLPSILRGIAAVACVAVCLVAGQAAYRATPGWEGFPDYLSAGRAVLDYPAQDPETMASELDGVSENDIDLMYKWVFPDDAVFDIGFFERAGETFDHYSVDYLIDSLHAKTTYLLLGATCALILFSVVIARSARMERSLCALVAGVDLMVLLSNLILIMRARPRIRVLLPIMVVGFFAVIAIVACRRVESSENPAWTAQPSRPAAHLRASCRIRALPIAIAVLVCAVGCLGLWAVEVRPLQQQKDAPTVEALDSYIDASGDDLVVLAGTQSVAFARFDALAAESWLFPNNVLMIGGWEAHTAPWLELLERYGLSREHTLVDMLDRDDISIVLVDSRVEPVRTYLEEHSGRHVEAELVEDFGPGLIDAGSDVGAYRFVSA